MKKMTSSIQYNMYFRKYLKFIECGTLGQVLIPESYYEMHMEKVRIFSIWANRGKFNFKKLL